MIELNASGSQGAFLEIFLTVPFFPFSTGSQGAVFFDRFFLTVPFFPPGSQGAVFFDCPLFSPFFELSASGGQGAFL